MRSLIPEDRIGSESWLDRGVLVYGPRKAGTTLFQNLLDGGDELLAYPAELKLKNYARDARPAWTPADYFAFSRVPQVRSAAFSVEKYTALWAAAAQDGTPRPLRDLVRFDAWCVAESAERPPQIRMWCAKEVGGGRRDIAAFWRTMFNPGKALFIVREPLAIVRSVLNDRRRKGIRLSAYQITFEVFDALRTLRRQARYIDDPNVHFTAYEDLVADPAHEMASVADFLGVARSPTLAVPTLFGEGVVVRTASRPASGVFRAESDWRTDLTQRERMIVAAAARLARASPGLAIDFNRLHDRISSGRAPTQVPGSRQAAPASAAPAARNP